MTLEPQGYDPHEAEATPGEPRGPGAAGPTGPAATGEQPGPGGVTGEVPGTPARPGGTVAGGQPTGVPAGEERHVTRAGMVWAAVATALVVMVLLIVFILQNQEYVQVKYFGLEGAVPLGIALFIAAVGGGILVAVAGAARIIQLRAVAHRRRVLAQRMR
ncbi:lipopolysaccharide assembly protein LapA domain-containing protein [Arthrobacter sp. 92]|uniref:LapA family protein n=1 Tax=Arthrobacter sp. 92 TaxID=3418175 RepID=UPI003D025156